MVKMTMFIASIILGITAEPRAPPKGGKFFYVDYTKDVSGFYWTSVILGDDSEDIKFDLLMATS